MYTFKDKVSGPKARCVVLGNRDRRITAMHETYSSTPALAALRALLSVSTHNNDNIDHIDISQAFTQSDDFPDDVFIFVQPPEFADEPPGTVWRLLKPLYGLKTAPKAWTDTLRKYLHENEWHSVSFEECLFFKTSRTGHRMHLAFYVDDVLKTRTKTKERND